MTLAETREWIELSLKALGIAGAVLGIWKFVLDRQKERREADSRATATRIAVEERAARAKAEAETLRLEGLRLDEVATWAERSISALQRVVLMTGNYPSSVEDRDRALRELGVELSVLVEVGRMFFRNDVSSGYGNHKEPAYRGLRPLLLDHVLLSHEVCRAWLGGNETDRERLSLAACMAERRFVSLVR